MFLSLSGVFLKYSIHFSIVCHPQKLYIAQSLKNGITKLGTGKYQIIVNPAETMLDAGMYEFDLRFTIGAVVKTPLSGTINIMETVFE